MERRRPVSIESLRLASFESEDGGESVTSTESTENPIRTRKRRPVFLSHERRRKGKQIAQGDSEQSKSEESKNEGGKSEEEEVEEVKVKSEEEKEKSEEEKSSKSSKSKSEGSDSEESGSEVKIFRHARSRRRSPRSLMSDDSLESTVEWEGSEGRISVVVCSLLYLTIPLTSVDAVL
jgi:hypothetical protein